MKTFDEMVIAAMRNLDLSDFCEKKVEFYSDRVVNYILNNYNKKCHCCSGASKFVIIFDDYDYIFKIPYHFNYVSCYDEETNSYKLQKFEFDYCYDYCQLEADKFEEAEEIDAEIANMLLIKTEFVCEINSEYNLYRQAKCEEIDIKNDIYRGTKEEINKTLKNENQRCDVNYRIAAYLFDKYDLSEALDLINRINHLIEICSITDLHIGNYGVLNGMPCILDYSGYEDI